ncbi:hypothetical protein [Desulfonema magnum]|uniref:hypothetical protein n=1 Tax=Desulfonema magnum TaxID=45655 RepID=UPI001A9AB89E|nr:hypothetical protein [Desulfonema magnum]
MRKILFRCCKNTIFALRIRPELLRSAKNSFSLLQKYNFCTPDTPGTSPECEKFFFAVAKIQFLHSGYARNFSGVRKILFRCCKNTIFALRIRPELLRSAKNSFSLLQKYNFCTPDTPGTSPECEKFFFAVAKIQFLHSGYARNFSGVRKILFRCCKNTIFALRIRPELLRSAKNSFSLLQKYNFCTPDTPGTSPECEKFFFAVAKIQFLHSGYARNFSGVRKILFRCCKNTIFALRIRPELLRSAKNSFSLLQKYNFCTPDTPGTSPECEKFFFAVAKIQFLHSGFTRNFSGVRKILFRCCKNTIFALRIRPELLRSAKNSFSLLQKYNFCTPDTPGTSPECEKSFFAVAKIQFLHSGYARNFSGVRKILFRCCKNTIFALRIRPELLRGAKNSFSLLQKYNFCTPDTPGTSPECEKSFFAVAKIQFLHSGYARNFSGVQKILFRCCKNTIFALRIRPELLRSAKNSFSLLQKYNFCTPDTPGTSPDATNMSPLQGLVATPLYPL